MNCSLFLFLLLSLLVQTCSGKSALKPAVTGMRTSTTVEKKLGPAVQIPDGIKLIIGAGGIYGAFLYYGTLQEDVFKYQSEDGSMFKAAWLLQFMGE